MYIFKANVLIYPPGILGTEIVGIFFILILQYVKLGNANTANKTEIRPYHIYTILYSIPVLLGYVFYLYFQTYVLTFDLILCAFVLYIPALTAAFSSLSVI